MVATETAFLGGFLAGVFLGPVVWTVYAALNSMQEAVQQDVEQSDDGGQS